MVDATPGQMDAAQALQYARASTFGLAALLHEKRFVELFDAHLGLDDPVRRVGYTEYGVGRDDRSVRYVENAEQLCLMETLPDAKFEVVADRQVRSAAVGVSLAPPPGAHQWSNDSLPVYLRAGDAEVAARPLHMLEHTTAAMLRMSDGVCRQPERPLGDRHVIRLNNGRWQRSKRLHLKGFVAVHELLWHLHRLGLLKRAAEADAYRMRSMHEWQMLLPNAPEVLGPYLNNAEPIQLHSMPQPATAETGADALTEAEAADLAPAGPPEEAPQEGSFSRDFFRLPDAMQPSLESIIWYGSRHAPLLFAVPKEPEQPLNGLSGQQALACASQYIERHFDEVRDGRDNARGFCMLFVPLYPKDAPTALPLGPLPEVARELLPVSSFNSNAQPGQYHNAKRGRLGDQGGRGGHGAYGGRGRYGGSSGRGDQGRYPDHGGSGGHGGGGGGRGGRGGGRYGGGDYEGGGGFRYGSGGGGRRGAAEYGEEYNGGGGDGYGGLEGKGGREGKQWSGW